MSDVSFEVSTGERVAILGESGSGKSTMINVLCGLYSPLSGSVTLNDQAVHEIPHEDRGFALVPQRPVAIPGLKGYDLLKRPARRLANASDRIDLALRKLNISDNLAKLPLVEMSGGQLQLMYLARVMVWDPSFLFLDEPFNSIDVAIKSVLYPAILSHQATTSFGLVLVTHDPKEAMLMCTRLIIMCGGRKVADGTADDLVADPPDSNTAMLIRGSATNLLTLNLRSDLNSFVVAKSVVGEIRGKFTPIGGVGTLPATAVGLFPWTEILTTDFKEGTAFEVVGGQGRSAGPIMLRSKDETIYATHTRGYPNRVGLRCITSRLLLYDSVTQMLCGRITVDAQESLNVAHSASSY